MTHVLSQTQKIGHRTAKNRILLPPLVCFNWGDQNGYETVSRAKHYGRRAQGGVGTLVVEATSVMPTGKICDTQLGLWEDGHKTQFEDIAKACHAQGSLVLVQLVHAGYQSYEKVVYSSSVIEKKDKTCLALSLSEIDAIKEAFVKAAVRAYEAGLDGVEVHGAHGYLLNQFTALDVNKRDDAYGGSLANRIKLSVDICELIRKNTSEHFIIGYRYGANDKTLAEDCEMVKRLSEAGVDLFNVSAGIGWHELVVPQTYHHHAITYMGTYLKACTDKPVAVVYGIRDAQQAIDLLEDNLADLVAVGRAQLADPDWTNRAIKGQTIDRCFHCQPRCFYGTDGRQCPYFKPDMIGE